MIDQRLAAAQRRLRLLEELEDQRLGLFHMRRPVRLLLRPAGAGHEQQVGVRPYGLGPDRRYLLPDHARAQPTRQVHAQRLDVGGVAGTRPRFKDTGINEDEPGPLRSREPRDHPLAVVPALDLHRPGFHANGRDVGVEPARDALRHARQRPGKARAARGHHHGRLARSY